MQYNNKNLYNCHIYSILFYWGIYDKKTKIALQNDDVSIKEYAKTLDFIKQQVKEAQARSVLAANKELIKIYWLIGKTIAEKQQENGWGSNIIEKLAQDLQNEFSGISGFSRRNIFRMQAFYLAYQKVPQAVAQLEALPLAYCYVRPRKILQLNMLYEIFLLPLV